MTREKNIQERACKRKRRYATASEAESTAAHRRAESGERDLEIYPCRFCGGWHIGHSRPPRGPRL